MSYSGQTGEPQTYYPMMLYGVEIPTRCFVGGLPYSMTELELNKFFSQFGSVKDSKIVTDRNGVSKGYGFVTYETEGEAASVCAKGSLYYKEKKLNISKAIRRQGGQYCKANQEYVNGQRLVYQSVSGYLLAQKNGSWIVEEPSPYCQPAKPYFQMVSPPPVYVGGGSQSPYIQSPVTPVTPTYYPTLPSPSMTYEPFPSEPGPAMYPVDHTGVQGVQLSPPPPPPPTTVCQGGASSQQSSSAAGQSSVDDQADHKRPPSSDSPTLEEEMVKCSLSSREGDGSKLHSASVNKTKMPQSAPYRGKRPPDLPPVHQYQSGSHFPQPVYVNYQSRS